MSKVAIIMRSKDEYPYVKEALLHLQKQTFKDYTLYHVDSGSTDGTIEAIKKYSKNPENLFQIHSKDYIPGKVLNDMIAKTKEEIIVLLNADAIPKTDRWLEKLILPIVQKKADITFSKQKARKDAFFIVRYDYQRVFNDEFISKTPHFFSAVSCAFLRKVWEKVKFYEKGYSEDVFFVKKAKEKGFRVCFVPQSVVIHSHNYTLKQLYQRQRLEGLAERVIFHTKPSLVRSLFLCLKYLLRDFFFSLKKGKILTIPYNICYRVVHCFGFYKGLKEGG